MASGSWIGCEVEQVLLVHPVIGLLVFDDSGEAHEAAEDIGAQFDLNEIGVLKSRVMLIYT
jgi:hypothetical protein